jgi:uncharacterized 2Fe-2S/4Fe-4S cluster protein (DUF4445 family)
VKRRTITFLPENRSVQVDEGVTIAEAAQIAEIIMNNLCGGEGVCGGCRLQVTQGHAEADEHARSLLSKAELEEGYVLACQTPIYDDLHVVIPSQSRMEEAKIMTGEASDTSLMPEDFPLVRKIHLELPRPSLEDNLADMERISRELRRKIGWHSYEILLPCLQNLSNTLRQHDFRVTATVAKDKNGYRILRTEPSDATRSNYGVAVDVGTTTVAAQLVDIATGKVVGVDASYNLQASYGEDVISRMIYACGKGGLDPLHQAVVKNINRLIEKLTSENGIPLEEINAVVAAGNTTMSHFLLGLTPCSIRLDPYVPTAYVYPQIPAKDVGIRINPNGILETIPSVASYVGGDIVAGVMSSGIADHPEVRGLIDIGTNGEIAIGNDEWLVCCSASAGPAFEGGGTTCGMRAARGAIEKVEITNGKLSYQTIGNASPRGICGSGLIDCIYELVKNKIIGADGKFHRDSQDTRLSMKDDVPQYIIATAEESETEKSIVITESDIENLIRSKGAVFAAIKSLMEYIGLGFEQIETFYVAGGFGTFLNVSKAVAIGLLPDISREKIRFIGNSSLTGARKCLLSESALEKCLNISRSMTNVELSAYQPFMDEFIAALFLPHTDRRLFPSITY